MKIDLCVCFSLTVALATENRIYFYDKPIFDIQMSSECVAGGAALTWCVNAVKALLRHKFIAAIDLLVYMHWITNL